MHAFRNDLGNSRSVGSDRKALARVFRCTPALLLMVTVIDPSSQASDEKARSIKMSNVVCGPRCAKFILEYYERAEGIELVHLIREVQWPD